MQDFNVLLPRRTIRRPLVPEVHMLRQTIFRALAPAAALVALAAAVPASAGAQLPIDPGGLLPDDPTGCLSNPATCLPGGDGGDGGGLPGGLPGGGELPGGLPGLPGELPGLPGLPGGESGTPGGAVPGGGSGTPGGSGGALGASAPLIAGPKKAPTVRVDSKGRFRVGGVVVTCPAACRLSVKVSGPGGASFVRRTFDVRAGRSLQLKKLKVSKKALKALRKAGVARVTARLKASPLTGGSVAREVGLKLKPARR
jgi:hypothetical protein